MHCATKSEQTVPECVIAGGTAINTSEMSLPPQNEVGDLRKTSTSPHKLLPCICLLSPVLLNSLNEGKRCCSCVSAAAQSIGVCSHLAVLAGTKLECCPTRRAFDLTRLQLQVKKHASAKLTSPYHLCHYPSETPSCRCC